MSRVPSTEVVASCLLNHALERRDSLADAMTWVCGRLRRQFNLLIGSKGCDLLLIRALQLAQATQPPLQGVRWETGDAPELVGLAEQFAECEPETARAAAVVLVSTLLSLLSRFLGWDMVLRHVQRAWPRVLFTGEEPPIDGTGRMREQP